MLGSGALACVGGVDVYLPVCACMWVHVLLESMPVLVCACVCVCVCV
jgi:hypothetical protein